MKAMQEQFSQSEVSTLRSYLLETLLDTNQAAEVLQMFLIGHGYGLSQDAAIEAATKAMAARMSLAAIREELERVALVM